MAPAALLTGVFFLVPMVLLVWMSFFHWPLLGVVRPAGVANYVRAFGDADFGRALWFSLRFTAVLVPASLLVSYLAAILVRRSSRVASLMRTAFFMPVVIGFAAAAYMASVLLMPSTGLINRILAALHLSDGTTSWFATADHSFWAIVVLSTWKGMGVAMILLMAAMQTVGEEVVEAAKIDGAGVIRRELHIMLPLVRRQLALCLLLALSGTLLTFDQFYVLTKGGPSGSTLTAVMYVHSQSFVRYNLGYGAALSMIITVVILGIAVVQLRALRATGRDA